MATGTPKDYLKLSSGSGAYGAGGATPGSNVTTTYTMARFDPETSLVDISDQTFSTSTGTVEFDTTPVTSMPLGVAMNCVGDGTATAAAIDLTGTPFAVHPGQFVQGGAGPVGGATYSLNNQYVQIAGGGFCGFTMPGPSVFNPFNQAGGFQLLLDYP